MHKCLVFACKSQDFAHSPKFFARFYNCDTVRFRNSGRANPTDKYASQWRSKPEAGKEFPIIGLCQQDLQYQTIYGVGKTITSI